MPDKKKELQDEFLEGNEKIEEAIAVQAAR